jgi:predicted amidohydrolase YtcJ
VAVRYGRIHAIGTRQDAQSWGPAEVVDFGGAVLTPGLVDCHVHPVMGLDMTRGCDLSGITDLAAVRALLRAEAEVTPAGEWVRGWGLDPNAFGSVPVRRELIDDVVSGLP